jgi:hypothetical protein
MSGGRRPSARWRCCTAWRPCVPLPCPQTHTPPGHGPPGRCLLRPDHTAQARLFVRSAFALGNLACCFKHHGKPLDAAACRKPLVVRLGAAPEHPAAPNNEAALRTRTSTRDAYATQWCECLSAIRRRRTTFDMSGGRKLAKQACGRPLDGGVRWHVAAHPVTIPRASWDRADALHR